MCRCAIVNLTTWHLLLQHPILPRLTVMPSISLGCPATSADTLQCGSSCRSASSLSAVAVGSLSSSYSTSARARSILPTMSGRRLPSSANRSSTCNAIAGRHGVFNDAYPQRSQLHTANQPKQAGNGGSIEPTLKERHGSRRTRLCRGLQLCLRSAVVPCKCYACTSTANNPSLLCDKQRVRRPQLAGKSSMKCWPAVMQHGGSAAVASDLQCCGPTSGTVISIFSASHILIKAI